MTPPDTRRPFAPVRLPAELADRLDALVQAGAARGDERYWLRSRNALAVHLLAEAVAVIEERWRRE